MVDFNLFIRLNRKKESESRQITIAKYQTLVPFDFSFLHKIIGKHYIKDNEEFGILKIDVDEGKNQIRVLFGVIGEMAFRTVNYSSMDIDEYIISGILKRTILVEYYKQSDGNIGFFTYGDPKYAQKIGEKHKLWFGQSLNPEMVEFDYERIREICLNFKSNLKSIHYKPNGYEGYGNTDLASVEKREQLKTKEFKFLDQDAKIIKEVLSNKEILLKKFEGKIIPSVCIGEEEIELGFRLSKEGTIILLLPELKLSHKKLDEVEAESKFYSFLKEVYAEIVGTEWVTNTHEIKKLTTSQMELNFSIENEGQTVQEALQNIVETFPHIEPDILYELDKLLARHKKEKVQYPPIDTELFFAFLEDRDNEYLKYITDFSKTCLDQSLEHCGEALVNFFIKEMNCDTGNDYHMLCIENIIRIICNFNFENNYLSLDDGNRVRLSTENKSFPIELTKLGFSDKLGIFNKLYFEQIDHILSKEVSLHNDPIQKYRNICNAIRSLDKERLKEIRWARIFCSKDLSFSNETKKINKEEINDPCLYDEELFKKHSYLLFPSFGDINFEKNKVTILNTGDGCIACPTLEIYHSDSLIIKVRTENISLAGKSCTFTLDSQQIKELKKLNPNAKPVDLFLLFEKYDKQFKLHRTYEVSSILENVSISDNSYDEFTLLHDLIDTSIRLTERKYTKKVENLHNDFFVDALRNQGYNIADQSRSGCSSKGNDAGELDIMIRKSSNGTPVAIIEAFRLDSCGEKNNVIDMHINKLLHNYDTVGHEKNYILIYAEAKDFKQLWKSYINYVSNLNNKEGFTGDYKLIDFRDTEKEFSDKADIRVGLARHQRCDYEVNVFHVFMNISTD